MTSSTRAPDTIVVMAMASGLVVLLLLLVVVFNDQEFSSSSIQKWTPAMGHVYQTPAAAVTTSDWERWERWCRAGRRMLE